MLPCSRAPHGVFEVERPNAMGILEEAEWCVITTNGDAIFYRTASALEAMAVYARGAWSQIRPVDAATARKVKRSNGEQSSAEQKEPA